MSLVADDVDVGSELSLGHETVLSQLKHGLGDLKAEWLLMRRDIQQVRHQAASLRALGMRSKVGSG